MCNTLKPIRQQPRAVLLFSVISFTYPLANPISVYRHAFSLVFCCWCFVYLFSLTLIRFILLLFYYYIWNVFNLKLICSSNRAGWVVDLWSLSPILCDSNMLDHVNFLSLKFLMFLYFPQNTINFLSLIFFFLLLHLCYLVIWFRPLQTSTRLHPLRWCAWSGWFPNVQFCSCAVRTRWGGFSWLGPVLVDFLLWCQQA